MRRGVPVLIVCSALVFAAGCGSSESSSSTSTATSTPHTSPSGGLKPTTTPKFATATGPVRSGAVQIAYRNIAIAPDTVKIKVGSTIKWTNFDSVEHNVISQGGPQKFASK